MKKTNKQKILEAKANLDIAKMLEAINNISEKREILERGYSNDLERVIENLEKTKQFIEAFNRFKKNSKCIGSDLKLVKDVVEGIKSKSKYEMEIKELNSKLEIARNVYNIAITENRRIKEKLVKFVEVSIDSKLDKEEVKTYLSNTDNNIDNIIRKHYQEEVKCEIEEQAF